MTIFSKFKTAVAVGAIVAMPSLSSADIHKGETAGAGSSAHTTFVTFVNQAAKVGVNIEVNAGQTLTKSMLKGAKEEISFFSAVPVLAVLMSKQAKMYAKIKDAPELASNLRSIFGYAAGAYHAVTLAGSGIETWEDIKGKDIYTGPPSGAAAVTSESIIRALTGFEPNEDYKAVRLAWGEGTAALADGKVNMMIRPTDVGSAAIERFGLTGEFRLLSIPDDSLETEKVKKLTGGIGRTLSQFHGSIYKNQLTEGIINALGYNHYIGTHAGVSENDVYKVTKAFWEALDQVHATALFMKGITLETAFTSLPVPLHPGAIRYYEEVGVEIPDALRS